MPFKEFHYQVRGRGHAAEGTHVQDRTAYKHRSGVQVLCLADGAGSASHADHGAQTVVDAGCALLVNRFEEFSTGEDAAGARGVIIETLVSALEETARRVGCEVADLASTFLTVAVSVERFVVAHVGDGVIGYIKNDEMKVASAPDNAEFANETTFVTSSGATSSLRLYRGSLEGVSGFILMSDGTSASLFDQRTRSLAPACAKLISVVANARAPQSKNPEYKKRIKRVINTQVRQATKDDCAIGILARR
ncbi:PP2C family serine/threonine-protein phosphatase [Cryobacterium sp. BB736]|uniref:PP2C family serine/threonine-protein phosphatase n=1 Tax=Cryobacterium sp. BB736 TaxID=2746963 RepID=UPI001874360A|nr:PP2C family serine/threonine-protein phosphatase [Cryobacterium sp. BB736]